VIWDTSLGYFRSLKFGMSGRRLSLVNETSRSGGFRQGRPVGSQSSNEGTTYLRILRR